MYRANPGCEICGSSLDYIRCWGCDGAGAATALCCNICDGRGGWWNCSDTRAHTTNNPPIPDDLKADWFWWGSALTNADPGRTWITICTDTYPPPACFDKARTWEAATGGETRGRV
jgi:hypothetical protein